jgi:hypothetical protein
MTVYKQYITNIYSFYFIKMHLKCSWNNKMKLIAIYLQKYIIIWIVFALNYQMHTEV